MENNLHPADAGRDWSGYNGAQQGRRPRALVEAALAAAGPGRDRTAVELGCGAGIEAKALAEAGWQVHTFDRDPSVVPALEALAADWPITHTHVYLRRSEIDSLLDGLDVVDLSEQEFDGPAFSGPKHWHLFNLVARNPAD